MPYISKDGRTRPYELTDAYKQIQELRKLVEELRSSIDNLIKQTGRYNTEKAYEQLVAMFKSQMGEG